MTFSNLDTIVRSQLMNSGLSLHCYVQGLKHGSDILRELSFDDLLIINSEVLTINSHQSITLPDGFIDDIGVFIQNGQYLKPLVKTDGFNRMFNYDSGGNPIDWPSQTVGYDSDVFGLIFPQWYSGAWDRSNRAIYGYRSDGRPYTYEVIKERNEIQLNQNLSEASVVLQYISDGRTITAASQINSYAEKTIETYIDWGLSPKKDKPYKMSIHESQRRVLRARMNELTTKDLVAIFRKNKTATYK